jgi:DNA polymerase-3 subunit beta
MHLENNMNHQPIAPAENPTAILDRAAFTAAIDTAILAVEKHSTIPILSNVLLAAEAGALKLTAFNLDMEIRVRVQGDVDGRLSTTLPASLLQSICRNAQKSERLTIAMLPAGGEESGGNRFESVQSRITAGKTGYTVNSISPDEYPELDAMSGETWKFTLPGSVLWNAIDAVRKAISTEETRYYLNGVFLFRRDDDANVMRAVATDGHRLYCQEMEAPKGSEGIPGVIIPRGAVDVLHKLLKGKTCPKQVKVKLSSSQVMLSWNDIDVRTKLIDGTFPDYARVVPSGNSNTAEFLAKRLDEAIRAVTAITDVRGKAVRVSFAADKTVMSCIAPDAGTSWSDIICDYEGEPLTVGFNSTYLREMVADACPAGGYITMRIADATSPVLVVGAQRGWFGVLMPTRV